MSFAIGLVIGLVAGCLFMYWAMKIEKDIGKFTEYQE
jgi:hypothetical protein